MQAIRLFHLLFLGLFGLDAHASDPVVSTQNGQVRGAQQGQVEWFKALPFAAPPTGNLRWMPPEDPANWTGIREASHFSPQCPQKRPDGVFVGNEDCLYLNVFRPSGATALPVMVFIHGGALISGSASVANPKNLAALYDGSRLAENGNVVVVTLNYRLGPLGFIGHPKLSATSGYGASGNYAYMDQIQALKWVQRNIAAFGGDRNNVTLFGQSAGATSVWILLSSPLSKGLFHRAIVHSGVREGATPASFAEDKGTELSQKLNCSGAADELDCMRKKSAKDVVDAMPSVPGSGYYPAVVDGRVLTDSPIAVMRRGQHHHMPILQGNVADERSQLGLKATHDIVDQPTYEMAVRDAVQKGQFPPGVSVYELLRLYPMRDYPSPPEAYDAIFADMIYLCSSREVLRALSASQNEFVGRFYYTHVYTDGPGVIFGASHAFELPFVFDTPSSMEFSPTADEAALVKTFQDTWSTFARTGTPPAFWTRYDPKKDNHVIFDTPMASGEHLHAKQCDYWDRKFGESLN